MATHDAQGRELFICGECKCRRIATEFQLDRHGHRRKCCKACKTKRESRKCPHGKQKWDCKTCSPGKFCEHGKCKTRHTCRVCDAAGNERRKHIRNAREFANQFGGWPYEHVRCWAQDAYDANVSKWKAVFEKLLANGDIDEGLHAQILANLKPWNAQGHSSKVGKLAEPEEPPKRPVILTDDELADLLGFAL